MSSPWHELRFRLDHRWTPPHMSAYLDSELPARARSRLERHTAECPECWAVLEQLQYLLALLHAVPPPEPGADAPAIAGAVLRRLHEPADR
jgi:anti-sigma factor RsiW